MNPKRNIFRFRGVPKKNQPDTPSRWQQFIDALFSWIKKKREEGDAFIDAKVKREQAAVIDTLASADVKFAEADKVRAETELIRQQAKQIAENAEVKEQELLVDETQSTDLQEDLAEFTDFLKVLYYTYGTTVSFSLVHDEKGQVVGVEMTGEGLSGTFLMDSTKDD